MGAEILEGADHDVEFDRDGKEQRDDEQTEYGFNQFQLDKPLP